MLRLHARPNRRISIPSNTLSSRGADHTSIGIQKWLRRGRKSGLDAYGKGHAMKAWFVPPIVIPVAIVLVVAAYAVIRALH